jgi:VIT1/CCC1 family predicted Fe2+/Mn2+ transporter
MSQAQSQRMSSGSAPGAAEPSLGQLFGDLAKDVQTLFKQELTLAKTETTQSAKRAAMDVAKIVAGALVLYTGVIFLLGAAVFGLRELDLPWSLSALIVGAVVAVIGLFLVLRAKSDLTSGSLAPTETIESLKQDGEWAKGQVR